MGEVKFETKFNVGDEVFRAETESVEKVELCPTCLGQKLWWAVTPAGEWVHVECSTCDVAWGPQGRIVRKVIVPKVWSMVIAKIEIDQSFNEQRIMYSDTSASCSRYLETGLFAKREEALADAVAQVEKRTAWLAEQNEKLEGKKRKRKVRKCNACGGRIYR
jgi:hypothetical protein